MRVVTDLPRPVRVIDHVWIPLSDGIRLGARIWLPEDADDDPVPAILEYLPYRKGDGTACATSRATPTRGPRLRRASGSTSAAPAIRRLLPGRVPPAGAGRRPRGARVDRGAALVHGRRRHVRHLVGRLQRAAGGGARAAGS